MNFAASNDLDEADRATLDAALAMLEPLAGMLLARGLRYARAEELLKTAFVQAGARAYAAQGKPPSVSTLSVATGLRRREVQRLVEEQPSSALPPKVSLAAQVRMRWTTDPLYLDAQGQPRRLPRTAPPGQASFAALAAAVSRDVHARPLLDELVRIGAAEEDGDHVLLRRDLLNAPDRSWDELVSIGGANVADHLSAVLVNLLSNPRPLFEQAIFADGLTKQSAQRGADLAKQVWQQAAPDLRDKLQTLVDLDEQASDNGWRMRIGLYTYIAPADRPAAPVRAKRAMRAPHEPGSAKAATDKESASER
jgi:Family of unknown function (DUF6502)